MVKIARIEGATRFLGKSQGYYELPVRDDERTPPTGPDNTALIEAARTQARKERNNTRIDKLSADLLDKLADALETLPLLDKIENYTVPGPATPVMVTAWEPTPDEIKCLSLGANIHVELVGRGHPPIMVKVGPLPT